MKRFNVGDRVKVVYGGHGAPVGLEGEVVATSNDVLDVYFAGWDGGHSGADICSGKGHWLCEAHELELVGSPKFKTGDRVRLVKDGLSTRGAVGMLGLVRHVRLGEEYPYQIQLDEGGTYESHAVKGQYRWTWAKEDALEAASAPDFAVGSRVEFTDEVPSRWWFASGQRGTITAIDPDCWLSYTVIVDGVEGWNTAFASDEHLRIVGPEASPADIIFRLRKRTGLSKPAPIATGIGGRVRIIAGRANGQEGTVTGLSGGGVHIKLDGYYTDSIGQTMKFVTVNPAGVVAVAANDNFRVGEIVELVPGGLNYDPEPLPEKMPLAIVTGRPWDDGAYPIALITADGRYEDSLGAHPHRLRRYAA